MSYEKRLTNYKVKVRSNDFYYLQFDQLIFLNFGPEGSELIRNIWLDVYLLLNFTGDQRVASLRLSRITVFCPLARHIICSLVLLQTRKTGNCPDVTEKLLTGMSLKSINTNNHQQLLWFEHGGYLLLNKHLSGKKILMKKQGLIASGMLLSK